MTHLAKLLWPEIGWSDLNGGGGGAGTMDAAGEMVAFIGYCRLEAGSGSKTISSAGGKIAFRLPSITWGNAGTTMDIGIQDVAAGTGPPMQPDGTFDVKATVAGLSGLVTNTWNDLAMTTGSKTIADGDLIAVVWHMTARVGGADTVSITGGPGFAELSGLPILLNNAGSWTLVTNRSPNCFITFDDGSFGMLEFCYPINTSQDETVIDSSSPDEKGMQFQVPFNCSCDGIWICMNGTDANSGCTIRLFENPISGTPTILSTLIIPGQQLTTSAGVPLFYFWKWPSAVDLVTTGTYGIALRATGTTANEIHTNTMGNANWNKFVGGTSYKKIYRDGGSGTFTAETPTLSWYLMGVRIEPSAAAPSGGASFHAHMSG